MLRKLFLILMMFAVMITAYYGTIENVKWCWNIFAFKSWWMLFTFCVCVFSNEKEIKDKIEKSYQQNKHAPEWFDNVFYFSIIVLMAATGHYVYAVIYVLCWATDTTTRDKSMKKLTGQDKQYTDYENTERAG